MWTKNFFKNGAFRKRWRHHNHVISLHELFLPTYPEWPVIDAFSKSSGVLRTESNSVIRSSWGVWFFFWLIYLTLKTMVAFHSMKTSRNFGNFRNFGKIVVLEFSEISYRDFPFDFTPWIYDWLVRISEIQQFPDFWKRFKEISVPFLLN